VIGSGLLSPGVLAGGLVLALLAVRALNRFRQLPASERQSRIHVNATASLVVALIVIAIGILGLFHRTESRAIVPQFDYVQVGRYGSHSYYVTDSSGTKYLATWSVFSSLHAGSAYTCQVRVYAVLLRPKLMSCRAGAPGLALNR
jgi:cytochrome b561